MGERGINRIRECAPVTASHSHRGRLLFDCVTGARGNEQLHSPAQPDREWLQRPRLKLQSDETAPHDAHHLAVALIQFAFVEPLHGQRALNEVAVCGLLFQIIHF